MARCTDTVLLLLSTGLVGAMLPSASSATPRPRVRQAPPVWPRNFVHSRWQELRATRGAQAKRRLYASSQVERDLGVVDQLLFLLSRNWVEVRCGRAPLTRCW